MGLVTGGILGKFSGKVGNIVGAVSGGQNIVKAMPSSYNDKNSTEQQAQRSAFAQTVALHKLLSPAVKALNKERAATLSAFNVFMKKNVGKSISDAGVSYADLKISSGSLQGVDYECISHAGANAVEITWADNTNDTTAFANDEIVVAMINEDTGDVVNSIAPATRADGTATVSFPASWDGINISLYVEARTADQKKATTTTRVMRFMGGSELAGSVQ
jgi:hypothetical protein